MSTWLVNGVFTLAAVLACTGLFFFVATRGKLTWSGLTGAQDLQWALVNQVEFFFNY